MGTWRPDMTEAEQRTRAVRVVAGAARDVDELRYLLDVLGLDPRESAAAPRPERARRRPDQGVPLTELAAMLASAGARRA